MFISLFLLFYKHIQFIQGMSQIRTVDIKRGLGGTLASTLSIEYVEVRTVDIKRGLGTLALSIEYVDNK